MVGWEAAAPSLHRGMDSSTHLRWNCDLFALAILQHSVACRAVQGATGSAALSASRQGRCAACTARTFVVEAAPAEVAQVVAWALQQTAPEKRQGSLAAVAVASWAGQLVLADPACRAAQASACSSHVKRGHCCARHQTHLLPGTAVFFLVPALGTAAMAPPLPRLGPAGNLADFCSDSGVLFPA